MVCTTGIIQNMLHDNLKLLVFALAYHILQQKTVIMNKSRKFQNVAEE